MEVLKFIWKILVCIWQLPQIIAACLYHVYITKSEGIVDTCYIQGAIVFIKKKSCGSVTLGPYIFLSPMATDTTVRHEWGHTRQSLILGPLYLIVIGIPSIIWALVHKKIAPDTPYFDFFTEKWANKLGGIE